MKCQPRTRYKTVPALRVLMDGLHLRFNNHSKSDPDGTLMAWCRTSYSEWTRLFSCWASNSLCCCVKTLDMEVLIHFEHYFGTIGPNAVWLDMHVHDNANLVKSFMTELDVYCWIYEYDLFIAIIKRKISLSQVYGCMWRWSTQEHYRWL